ncbi:MAG: aldo/keto reductase [Chloroflexi bacterium]|nr:aldo/keto reductase [Chloroflexota bacterium]
MERIQFAEFALSRLMLGTVQLGLPYGIANRTGQPSYQEARDILACAYEGGVNCLDTAAIYGTSEEVLGRALAELGIADKMTVVSKVRYLAPGLDAATAAAIVEESVVQSLKRLGLEALPICLFHVEDNFCYAEALLRLKERGLVRHIGSSVMTPAATAAIVETGQAEALQIPTSVLDRRYSHPEGGIIRKAAERGMAVFVRSIYLQGLLLLPEEDVLPELAGVIPPRGRLQALAAEAGMSLGELAVRYVLSLDGVTCGVVGIETVEQMRQNLIMFAKGPLDAELRQAVEAAVPELPDKILMPNQWSKRMADVKRQEKPHVGAG